MDMYIMYLHGAHCAGVLHTLNSGPLVSQMPVGETNRPARREFCLWVMDTDPNAPNGSKVRATGTEDAASTVLPRFLSPRITDNG